MNQDDAVGTVRSVGKIMDCTNVILRGCEDIEKLDDVDDDKYSPADTYGFLRTDFCKNTFGNGEKK